MTEQFDVFVSYSWRDRPWASSLAASLKRQGLQVWLDEEQLPPGADVTKAIARGLAKSKIVVTVVDPKSGPRPNVFLEAGMAVALGKDVIFVVPEDEVSSGRLPFDLAKKKAILRRSPTATARDLVNLKKLIFGLPEGREVAPGPKGHTPKKRSLEHHKVKEVSAKKRTMSPADWKRIAEATKKRWSSLDERKRRLRRARLTPA